MDNRADVREFLVSRRAYDSDPSRHPNFARYTFLDDDSHRFYLNWEQAADTCVAILRTEAGRDPYDNLLHDLVDELSTRSEDFRHRWSAHNVRYHGAGTKRFHHDVVGDRTCARPVGLMDRRPDGGHEQSSAPIDPRAPSRSW